MLLRLCCFLLILPTAIIFQKCGFGSHIMVNAQIEDILDEDDDDEAQIEMDDSLEPQIPESPILPRDEEEEETEKPLKPSPDANTYFLFTKPAGASLDLPAGRDVQFLVGFENKGSKDFIVDGLDASFRYPMDFSFHILNFTPVAYNKVVRPKHEATFFYSFFTNEAYSARPFGLIVNLFYKDKDDNYYMSAVFNETVNIVEIDDGLDGETFFLYVFLAACVVLLVVVAHQFFSSYTRRKSSPKQKIETGTQNHDDVDYDWLPKETLELSKSPKRSPRHSSKKSPKRSPKHSPKQQSPRQRKVKRATGGGED